MTIDRPNLADAFGGTARSRGLQGLLPPPRPRAAPVQPNDADAPGLTQARRAVAHSSGSATAAVGAGTENPKQPGEPAAAANVAVYLEPNVLQQAKTYCRQHGITYDELLVLAFESITDTQLRQTFSVPADPTSSPMPSRQRRVRGTAGIQVQLRLDATQRAWLAEKQRAVHAPSRSALVATALRLHLAT